MFSPENSVECAQASVKMCPSVQQAITPSVLYSLCYQVTKCNRRHEVARTDVVSCKWNGLFWRSVKLCGFEALDKEDLHSFILCCLFHFNLSEAGETPGSFVTFHSHHFMLYSHQTHINLGTPKSYFCCFWWRVSIWKSRTSVSSEQKTLLKNGFITVKKLLRYWPPLFFLSCCHGCLYYTKN